MMAQYAVKLLSYISNFGPQAPTLPCDLCGMVHPYVCPRIKAVDIDPSGAVTRIELATPSTGIAYSIWPKHAPTDVVPASPAAMPTDELAL